MARRSAKNGPHPIDVYVGKRMNERRILLGISQQKLGELTGVTFQQVQKRTTGINRMGASALHATAQALGVPVAYFFEGLDSVALPAPDPALSNRRSLAIVRALQDVPESISNPILLLIRAIRDEPAQAVA